MGRIGPDLLGKKPRPPRSQRPSPNSDGESRELQLWPPPSDHEGSPANLPPEEDSPSHYPRDYPAYFNSLRRAPEVNLEELDASKLMHTILIFGEDGRFPSYSFYMPTSEEQMSAAVSDILAPLQPIGTSRFFIGIDLLEITTADQNAGNITNGLLHGRHHFWAVQRPVVPTLQNHVFTARGRSLRKAKRKRNSPVHRKYEIFNGLSADVGFKKRKTRKPASGDSIIAWFVGDREEEDEQL